MSVRHPSVCVCLSKSTGMVMKDNRLQESQWLEDDVKSR